MNNPDPIAASLAAAEAAKNNAPAGHYVPPANNQTPTVFQPQGGAAVVAGPKGHKLSISSMQKSGSNSLNVDNFLGVSKTGVFVNFPSDDPRKATDGAIALKPLVLFLDYSQDVAPKYSIRIQTPGGIKFFHSRDRVMMDDGVTPWDAVINRCKQTDPKCKGDYPSIDISGVLLEPAVLITGKEILPAGKRVGFSTAIMNWSDYQLLHQQLVATDLVIEYDDNTMEGKVVIQIGAVVKRNKGGIEYGGFTFQCLGKGDDVVLPNAANAAPAAAPAAVAPIVNTAAYNPAAAAAAPAAAAPGTVNTAAYAPSGAAAAAPAAEVAAGGQTVIPPTTANTIPGAVLPDAGVTKPRRSRKAAGEAAA